MNRWVWIPACAGMTAVGKFRIYPSKSIMTEMLTAPINTVGFHLQFNKGVNHAAPNCFGYFGRQTGLFGIGAAQGNHLRHPFGRGNRLYIVFRFQTACLPYQLLPAGE